MYKKPLALLLATLMILAMFPIAAFAAPGNVHQVTSWPDGKAELFGGAPEWVFFKQGSPPSNGIAAIWTPEELDSAAKENYFSKVQAADPSIKSITLASVSFFYGDQTVTNSNNNTGQYQVGQINGVWYVFVSGGLSHFYYSEGAPPVDPRVRVEVTAPVVENFRKIELQDQYQYDVQDFYQYDVQDFYQYDVQDFYKYDVQDFYKYDVQDFYMYDAQDFYERDVQKFYIPVFEKKAVKAGDDTLVTWRNNKTVPGGTFGNGMTYLEINAEKARNEGYTFGIADSSPGNKYVGYDYHVRIEGNDLIISFDDRFISADVSAKVYNAAPAKHDPSGHKTLRTGDELRIPLPAPAVNSSVSATASATAMKDGNNVTVTVKAGSKTFAHVAGFVKNAAKTYVFDGYAVEVVYNGNGVKSAKVVSQPPAAPSGEPSTEATYYLFFHIASGVNYYETADYNFVGWRLAETKYGEYGLVDTVTGESYFVKTETGDPYFVNTETGDPYLVNTETGDRYFVKTETGDPYLVSTETGDRYLVADNVEISNEAGARPYTGTLTLTVEGVEHPLDEAFYLEPGEYEFTLSFAGHTVTENWTVAAGAENKFEFAVQYIDGPDEISYATDLVGENKLADVTTENKLADVTTENKLADVTTENKLADATTENKLADVTTENKLVDMKTDKELPDVYRGSEDPEDPVSIQYGVYTPARP